MKKLFIPLLIIVFLLCGCVSESSSSIPNKSKSLEQMSDYELLTMMAQNNSVSKWAVSSYLEYEDELQSLMARCPEFAELMSRETGVDSFKNYKDTLEKEYPGCMFDYVAPFVK